MHARHAPTRHRLRITTIITTVIVVLLLFATGTRLFSDSSVLGLLRRRDFSARAHASTDEGCLHFCDAAAGAACPHHQPDGGDAPDACVLRNVVLRDSAEALEFAAPRGALPARLALQPGPLRFEGVVGSGVPLSRECVVRGTTLLVTNYQQHIPHFGEGLFFALSGLLVADGELLCLTGHECHLMFHQRVHWPERVSVAWHEGALAVAKDAVPPHLPKALNTDLFNVAGAARSAELMPGCSLGALEFERIALVNSRYGRRWFSGPPACASFRDAALRLHVPGASDMGVLQRGAIALLERRGSRNIVNIDEVREALLKRFGVPVRMLSFEGLTFGEQVRALHDVRLLVAPHGAGLTNLVFLPPGAALVEIFPLHWRPGLYFDSLAESCGVWHGAYQNEEIAAAELSASCRETFGEHMPPLLECPDQARCIDCGKQSSTSVDVARLDVVIAAAEAHLKKSSVDT